MRQESGGGTTPVSSPGCRPQCLDSEKPATALVAHEIPKATAQNEEVPWGFLWVSDRFGVVSDEVENFVWTPAPGGGRYYDAAHEWDIPAN